jgi:hypothetical protein
MSTEKRSFAAGPRRLILIQSGKFDYAELDLTRPFQLVGVNGLGKTALISTLQYLYLDSQKDMRFGQHSTDDSRKFYFKAESSFILYECETSLGTVTLGARGLGPVGGYDLQRFSWTGGFERSDFINEDSRPRVWDDVRLRLSGKGLKVMTDNVELRRLLGAVDEETSESWGLVPLADARDYPRFRQTFQRLLQLRDLRQDDLKQLLADCAKLGASEREIDLAKEFEREIGKITRDRAEVDSLRAAAPRVREVRGLNDQEYVARAIAHAVSAELQVRFAGYAEQLSRDTAALHEVNEAARAESRRLKQEGEELQSALKQAAKAEGAVQEKLLALKQARGRYADFVLEVEEQARDRLFDEVAGLKMKLEDLPKEPVDVLSRQLDEKKTLLAQREAAGKRLSELFITWLRKRLPEESIARVGALFDRRILEAVIDEQVTVIDEIGLIERLKAAAECCDPRGYADVVVAIEFPVGTVTAASQIGRMDRLQEEIRALAREAERLARNIETLQNARQHLDRLPLAQKEHAVQLQSIAGYQRFRQEEARAEYYEESLGQCTREIKKLDERIAKNRDAHSGVEKEQAAILGKFEKLTTDDQAIRKLSREMPFATGERPGSTAVSEQAVRDLPSSLLEVFVLVRARCEQARAKSDLLASRVAVLDQGFLNASFRYDHSAPVADRLAQLEAEIASLEERSQSIESRWRAVLKGAQSSFYTMLKSLEAVTKQARKLNGELAKIDFSSIAEVRLEIVQNQAAVADYERHAKDSAQPSLFDTAEEADRKLDNFSKLLNRRPRLVLNELFSMRCEVRRKDGQKNFYDDFDQVESTGTTIVLKVTLNLLVLRDLLVPGKARIPYYLDEVHALDRQNFSNILQLSERLGFVGIYAAPTAAIGPRRFVHLVPDARGRLVVTAAHQKDIVRSPEEATEDAPKSDG